MTDAELVDEIEAQRSIMIAVSTGGYNQIEQENPDYKSRRERIHQALAERHLPDPNPHYCVFRGKSAGFSEEIGHRLVAVKRICQGELLSDSVSKSSSGVVFADRPIE